MISSDGKAGTSAAGKPDTWTVAYDHEWAMRPQQRISIKVRDIINRSHYRPDIRVQVLQLKPHQKISHKTEESIYVHVRSLDNYYIVDFRQLQSTNQIFYSFRGTFYEISVSNFMQH